MFLGVDIGGTTVKLGLVDSTGEVYTRREASVSFDGYATPILNTVIGQCRAFLADTGAQIAGVGVSATGQIDSATGTVIGTNGKIPNYEGAQIARRLSAALDRPVRVLNDANAAVLGECFAGRAKGLRDVVMLTIGTGVGGGIVSGGRLLEGTRSIAGELGHFTLYPNGLTCGCGRRGCYEAYASTTALVRRAEREAGRVISGGRAVLDAAAAGDACMTRALEGWLGDVSIGIEGLIHIFNPEMVLIGGGVSVREELIVQPLRSMVRAHVMPRFGENLKIERALLGNDAGLIGAVKFFMDGQLSTGRT